MRTNSNTFHWLTRITRFGICMLAGVFCLALVTNEAQANDPVAAVGEATPSAEPVPSRASVKSVSREKIVEYSRTIDALITAQLETKDEKRNSEVSDEIFLRRVYLDVVGRIPNLQETTQFLNSKSKMRRQELIDDLLDSYGYTSRQYNFWADTLRIKTRVNNSLGQSYIDFVKDSLEENKPYDEFVHDLLTSDGSIMAKGNGSVGYYIRDINMPEDNMSNTVRIFLGTRLECAQCHDHPFDKWTQRQYFEMVAFTGGMSYSRNNSYKNYGAQLRKMQRENPDSVKNNTVLPVVRNFARTLNSGVQGSGTGLARLPEGFLGKDGKEGEVITAKTMFEGKSIVDAKIPPAPRKGKKRKFNKKRQQQIPGAQQVDSREALADWMVDSDNPRFAKVIANRLWKQAFGLGLVEPIDVIEDATVPSNPELLDYLSKLMVDLDFDMKQYLRVLYNTRTYQSMVTKTDVTEPQKYNFNGPVMRRMTAEQIWDSMVGLAVSDIDARKEPARPAFRYMLPGETVYELYEETKDMTLEELIEFVDSRLPKNSKYKKKNGKESAGDSMKSAMQKQKFQYSDEQKSKKREMAKKLKAFNQKITFARRNGNVQLENQLLLKRAELMAEAKSPNKKNQDVRASELVSPAPPGHFLREFGQSDREQIDNANTEPAVTQVLMMMNGYIDTKIGSDQSSVLMRNVLSVPRGPQVVDAIFLSMLNRKPTSKERRDWMKDFQKDARVAYTDLIWTLANSNEFIFVK